MAHVDLTQALVPELSSVGVQTSPSHPDDPNDSLSFTDRLASWALSVNRHQVNDLLKLLHSVSCVEELKDLPSDSRSLLGTPRGVQLIEIAGGVYYHFGLQKCLHLLLTSFAVMPVMIHVMINIDGLQLGKSSKDQLWPILGIVKAGYQSKPFVIGVYCGVTKPHDSKEFL